MVVQLHCTLALASCLPQFSLPILQVLLAHVHESAKFSVCLEKSDTLIDSIALLLDLRDLSLFLSAALDLLYGFPDVVLSLLADLDR